MTDLLLQYDYKPDGKCHCDGFPTDKYSKGDYQLRIRKTKGTFKIRYQGRSLTQWIPVSKMEEALKNTHDVALQA
jgi:hypothetical protein